MNTSPIRAAIRLGGLAAMLAAAAPVGAASSASSAPSPEAKEISRTSYREFVERTCNSDECGARSAPVAKNRRLELRAINCRMSGDADFQIAQSFVQVQSSGGLYSPPQALIVTPLSTTGTKLVGVNQPMHLPLTAGERLLVTFNDQSSRKWDLACTFAGEQVKLKP